MDQFHFIRQSVVQKLGRLAESTKGGDVQSIGEAWLDYKREQHALQEFHHRHHNHKEAAWLCSVLSDLDHAWGVSNPLLSPFSDLFFGDLGDGRGDGKGDGEMSVIGGPFGEKLLYVQKTISDPYFH